MRTATILPLLVLSVCSFAAAVDLYADAMVLVPAGTFIMGDGVAFCGEDEHEVTLTRCFYLGQHEVTNQEYLEAVQWAYDNGYVTATTSSVRDNLDGSTEELLDLDDWDCEIQFDGAGTFYLREASRALQWAYPGGYDPSNHPVKEVTWYGSVRYCDWSSVRKGLPRAHEHSGDWACNDGDPYGAEGYRLPTDAEWEYAAQYDDERIYPWGDEDLDCSRANCYYSGAFCVRWTSPVGSYPDAPEALGLSDMAGNVGEWCNDWWVCNLGTSPQTDPVGHVISCCRVLRGGSWSGGTSQLRCAYRFFSEPHPGELALYFGFRVARAAPASHTEGGPDVDRSHLLVESSLPNPFSSSTRIAYVIPGEGGSARVLLNIYDVTGRVVRTLVDDSQPSGSYTVTWDGTDSSGESVAPGVYFVRLTVGERSETRRIVLIR